MIKLYVTIILILTCANVFGQGETLQTVTDRGNTTTNSLQIGGVSVNGNLSVNGVGVNGIKLWSSSHPTDYYLSNTWDGTYWQLKSNHPSPVNVGHADNAAYSSNSGGLGGNIWGGTLLNNAPTSLIGIDPTTGIYQYTPAALRTWMGLGALAYQNRTINFHSYNNQSYYLVHDWDGTGWNLRSENDVNDNQNNVHLVNINGKAANAVKWGGQEFIGSNGKIDAFMTNQDGTNFYGYSTISQVKTALATTLQDVASINNTITGAELIRGIGNNTYFSSYNPTNTARSGYVYFGAGDNLTIEAENGANKILLNPNSGGNVGIGTTTPDEKLTVKGKIKATEIRVNGQGAPDYVFEESYNIGTLKELESYIKANKHLPEVPSAKEFERDGIALGDMNKMLLKKIEELTLHVIDMNKRMEKLEVENQKLKKNGN
ncbi:tail fiber protein [Pedobacter miscanthi]|uniref:tail fiber protein n=1 Tax=Pedobacter miscanthi TaxID=2259170 RepID=UPI00292FAFC9|nr:tail fiber protein [Pedobacter miscanthi]